MISALRPARGLGLRKTVRNLANRVGRAAHIGNYWRWVDPPELRAGIDIAMIVCPLRYDVLVRRDFLAFYAAHRDLYAADFDAFVALVKQGPYYRWFTESEAVRTKPDLLGNSAALDAAFVERLRRAARLYENVQANGFSPDYPITLKTAERLLPPTTDKQGPPTGKLVSSRYFLADGCHRLALLMALGHTRLLPGQFRVKCFRSFSPFDSTSLLTRSLSISPGAYFTFLSSRYCAPFAFAQGYDVVRYIAEHTPALLDEVLSLIQVDGYAAHIMQQPEKGGR